VLQMLSEAFDNIAENTGGAAPEAPAPDAPA
jgi:hypothetical protein